MQDRQGNTPITDYAQQAGAWMAAESVEPGTLLMLEQGECAGANPFRAVLACPSCGALGLLTRAQYDGLQPMLCAAPQCSAEYTLLGDQVHLRRAQ